MNEQKKSASSKSTIFWIIVVVILLAIILITGSLFEVNITLKPTQIMQKIEAWYYKQKSIQETAQYKMQQQQIQSPFSQQVQQPQGSQPFSSQNQQPFQSQSSQQPLQQPFQQSSQQPCGDGICDSFEQQNKVCTKDCGWSEDEENKLDGLQPPQQESQQLQPQQQMQGIINMNEINEEIIVEVLNSSYKTVLSNTIGTSSASKSKGNFKTGQDADIMLSGVDFNNAGGGLLFNHPGNVASDGKHLLLADRNNNRILIWNILPGSDNNNDANNKDTDNKNTINTPPDLVLGQPDFNSNSPGKTLDKFNWPVSVAASNGKVIVADTYNDRILIWNTFPTKNGQKADIEIKDNKEKNGKESGKRHVGWPWAVWTNGKKMVITSTARARVLIWNTFPTKNNQEADISLSFPNEMGTPRSIASDGKHLVIGDHNAFETKQGTFFWKNFPTKDNQKYDFFVDEVSSMEQAQKKQMEQSSLPTIQQPQLQQTSQQQPHSAQPDSVQSNLAFGSVLWPTMTNNGKLIGVSTNLFIWNSFPENENDAPDYVIGGHYGSNIKAYNFGGGQSGDGSGVVAAGGKLYISLSNGNKIVGYNSIPTKTEQEPDFVIGASDINTNTLKTNYFISNPIPATNGKSLFIGSDFDRTLSVWKLLPDENSAKPDFRYSNIDIKDLAVIKDQSVNSKVVNGKLVNVAMNKSVSDKVDNVNLVSDKIVSGNLINDNITNNKLIAVGGQKVFIWNSLPLNGEMPDITFNGKIGDVNIVEASGIANDDNYFYFSDKGANKVYVFEGIPDENSKHKFAIDVTSPTRISNNGKYLVVSIREGMPKFYKISDIENDIEKASKASTINNAISVINGAVDNMIDSEEIPGRRFNLPEDAILYGDKLFVADTVFNRVQIWNFVEEALAGKEPDIVLGEDDLNDVQPEIGKDKLFWPAKLAFDGSYLWVGEYKFSGRVLRFSVR